jgi:hypothetical protein
LPSTAPVTTDYGFTGSTIKGTGQGISASLAPTSVQPAVLPPQTKGLLATIASSPHTAPALIQTAGGMLTRYGQGKTSQAMLERADQLAADERKRYNANVGASLWGQPQNRG